MPTYRSQPRTTSRAARARPRRDHHPGPRHGPAFRDRRPAPRRNAPPRGKPILAPGATQAEVAVMGIGANEGEAKSRGYHARRSMGMTPSGRFGSARHEDRQTEAPHTNPQLPGSGAPLYGGGRGGRRKGTGPAKLTPRRGETQRRPSATGKTINGPEGNLSGEARPTTSAPRASREHRRPPRVPGEHGAAEGRGGAGGGRPAKGASPGARFWA